VKRKFKLWLERNLSGFAPYRAIVGGARYYQESRENFHRPEDFLYYGKNVRIGAGVGIAAPERLHVADNVGIDSGCYIQAVGGCHLGRGSQIGGETIILTIEHQYTGGESLPYDSVRLVKPVYIEDYVWIGVRSAIAPGVRIGEGSIIGMGSVVLQDVPPLAIVVGNPAQILTYRSKPDFDRVKELGAVIDPYKELPMLKVPPITKRKYKNELKEFGFDLSNGHEYFRYEKSRPLGERLGPVESPNGNQRQSL
jgi:acetyltransferase-like isoleucine patch superfamily enzyme